MSGPLPVRLLKWGFCGSLILVVGTPLWVAQKTGFWNGVDGWLDRKLR